MFQSAFRNNTSNWRNLTSSFFPAKKVILLLLGLEIQQTTTWLPNSGKRSPHKCWDSGKFSQWTSEWATVGLETSVPGMRRQGEVSFGRQSLILTLGEKHGISFSRGDGASTGASLTAGQWNEFVFPSRIFSFYSHDHIGPYSFLTQTSKILEGQFNQSSLTLEFSLE